MSASSDQDFKDLKRLLALKRHEQPPPGYFNTFSREVIGSIQAGGGSAGEGEANIALWLYSLLEKLQVRPSWGTAFGALVCVAMIGAMLYLDQPNPQQVSGPHLISAIESSPSPVVEPMRSGEALQPMTAGLVIQDVPEMNATSAPSLFDIEPSAFGFETESAGYR